MHHSSFRKNNEWHKSCLSWLLHCDAPVSCARSWIRLIRHSPQHSKEINLAPHVWANALKVLTAWCLSPKEFPSLLFVASFARHFPSNSNWWTRESTNAVLLLKRQPGTCLFKCWAALTYFFVNWVITGYKNARRSYFIQKIHLTRYCIVWTCIIQGWAPQGSKYKSRQMYSHSTFTSSNMFSL